MCSQKDNVVLSYHDSLLRAADLEILKGPKWLNDVLISFYFEYLQLDTFKNHPSLLFVSPEVTQCIKVTPPKELSIFLEPLNASKRSFIFFALNDNVRTDCSGGSHWSLLVFSLSNSTFYHLDSHSGSNGNQARALGIKLLKYFQREHVGRVIEPECLQQSNGYDCGIHVLCNVENIAKHVCKNGMMNGCGVVDSNKVLNKRRELLDLIRHLQIKNGICN